jgi:hypothetical protein
MAKARHWIIYLMAEAWDHLPHGRGMDYHCLMAEEWNHLPHGMGMESLTS